VALEGTKWVRFSAYFTNFLLILNMLSGFVPKKISCGQALSRRQPRSVGAKPDALEPERKAFLVPARMRFKLTISYDVYR
jgi:hypothetical protein